MNGAEFKRAQALLEGNVVKADAIGLKFAMAGAGTDEAAVDAFLTNYMGSQNEGASELEIAYEKINGKGSLKSDLESDYTFADEDRVLAMAGFSVDGSRLSADQKLVNMKIYEIDQAFDYGVFATDEEQLKDVFRGTTAQQRVEIITGYNKTHITGFVQKLKLELNKSEFSELKMLAKNGTLNTFETVYYAMQNGEIQDAIDTLKAMPKSEIDKLSAEWQGKGLGNMEKALLAHSSGIESYNIAEALEGNLSELRPAERASKMLNRANTRAKMEKDAGYGFGYWFLNAIGSDKPEMMEKNLARMNFAYAQAVQKDGGITNENSARIADFAGFTQTDAVSVQTAKRDAAETSAAVVGFTAAAILTGGASVAATAAATSASAAGLGTMAAIGVGASAVAGEVAMGAAASATLAAGTNKLVNSGATTKEMTHSAITGAIAAATIPLGAAAGLKAAAKVAQVTGQTGAEAGVGALSMAVDASTMMGASTAAEANWAEGEAAFKETAMAAGMGAAFGAAMIGAGKGFGKTYKVGKKVGAKLKGKRIGAKKDKSSSF